MARVVRSFAEPFLTTDGMVYTVRVAGRQGADGVWEGWIEFEPDDGSVTLRTRRETTQPTLAALEYWAYGLGDVYLAGALTRAIDALRPRPVPLEVVDTPAYDEPAPAPYARVSAAPPTLAHAVADADEAVLDPFAVHTKGEDRLRQQLGALSARHLCAIIRAHDLASDADIALDALDEAELVELIVAGVRARTAA